MSDTSSELPDVDLGRSATAPARSPSVIVIDSDTETETEMEMHEIQARVSAPPSLTGSLGQPVPSRALSRAPSRLSSRSGPPSRSNSRTASIPESAAQDYAESLQSQQSGTSLAGSVFSPVADRGQEESSDEEGNPFETISQAELQKFYNIRRSSSESTQSGR